MIFMRTRTGAPLDRDSNQAVKGRADEAIVSRMLANTFSDSRAQNHSIAMLLPVPILVCRIFSVANEAATVSALTAAFVARAWFRVWRWPPRDWIVAGRSAQSDG
jgi:hypothetical protein